MGNNLKNILNSFIGNTMQNKKSNFRDDLDSLKGELSIIVEDENGNRWNHIKDANTIVYIGRRDIIRLIGNNNATLRVPNKMKFGDQGHDPANPSQALPTDKNITNLNNIVFTKLISSTTFEDDIANSVSSVYFECILEKTEGNGSGSQIYSEAGLYTVDETPLTDPVSGLPNTGLFAVKHFGILTKTNNLRFIFRWKVTL